MLELFFFSEGRVDAILIKIGSFSIFLDSGFRANGLSVIKKLKKLGIEKIDWYIGTHGHKNHIGGAAPIIAALAPTKVLIPHSRVKEAIIKNAKTTKEKELTKEIKYEILKVGNPIFIQDYSIQCLGPLKIRKCSPGDYAENYNSLILRIDKGEKHLVLLTGDTSSSILSAIEKKVPGSLQSEVLKNPHHNGAQAESVLKKIKPKIVAVCNSSLTSSFYQRRLRTIGVQKIYTACKSGSRDFKLTYNPDSLSWIFEKL